jgi:hypothetical protein
LRGNTWFSRVEGRDVVILRVLHGKRKISSDDFDG